MIFLVVANLSTRAGSIPEPGFIMYGAVLNLGTSSFTSDTVVWNVSSPSSAIAVSSTTLNVNGQFFYIATVPFETRALAGANIGSATPNTLPLNSTATTYTRLASVNGTNATIVYASSGTTNAFTFGPADRGRIERVDLSVTLPLTFA